MKIKFNQSKFKLAVVSAVVIGSAGLSTAGYAATTGAALAIGSSIATSCTVSTTAISFAAYVPGSSSSDVDANGSITADCTLGGAVTIKIGQGAVGNPGAGSSDGVPIRQMNGSVAGNKLKYQLYSNSPAGSGGGTVWGNTDDTDVEFNAVAGSGGVNVKTVYGRIPGGQTNLAAGTYSDTVAILLTY